MTVQTRDKQAGGVTRVPFREIDSLTTDHPVREAAVLIHCHAVRRMVDLRSTGFDDLIISFQIEARDANDTGERVTLDDFLAEEGFGLDELGR